MILEIDISGDGTVYDMLYWLDKHYCQIKSSLLHGPAGGNPMITVQGNINNLRALVEDKWYGGSIDDFQELR